MMQNIDLREIDRLTAAATVMGEARGEPYEGKVAVAWVIRNRMTAKRWWGKFTEGNRLLTGLMPPPNSAVAVCRKPWQFSCWNKNDPSLIVCKTFSEPALLQRNINNIQFQECLRAVDQAFSGAVADPTFGATHYFNPKVAKPVWRHDGVLTATIGAHEFFRGID